ncbi:Spore germination protein YndE [Paenibacillus allorhizoplanae]|uniref:Spore germination protein YndE n=1 Tax=Paenibacillus allorhizoplanae TaxID=2905648 RepID=A0ABN8H7V6_9BACL|nr:GerAB/ArcD/ProY family transporter [Paenibacillus allorhizoplanae]CAH1226697.1 Spore germination protein YndE [Paenibacillus allorhizoplanae]
MKTVNMPIGPVQLFCLLFQSQFGLGVLSLPHAVNANAGPDGWIACLFGGLLNTILLILVWMLSQHDRSKTVFQMLLQRLGPYLGRLFILAFAVYSFTICYEALASWIFITHLWAYEKIPAWMLALLLIGGCTYLVSKPPRVFARFAVFATAFVPLFIALICYTLKDADLHNVMPLFSSGLVKIGYSTWQSMMSFIGLEILLVLSPCIQMPSKSILRIAIFCNITITAIYMLCVFASMAIFNSEVISFIRHPLLFQFKTISFKLIERTDIIVLAVWILFIITTLSTYLLLFVSSVTAIASPKKGIKLPTLLVCALVLILLGQRELDVSQLSRFQNFVSLYVPAAAIGIPAMMLMMIYLKRWLSGGKGVRT